MKYGSFVLIHFSFFQPCSKDLSVIDRFGDTFEWMFVGEVQSILEIGSSI